MKPRGLRNNNPLNIRHSADSFQGEIKGSDTAFKKIVAAMSRIENGCAANMTEVRAGFKLQSKIKMP